MELVNNNYYIELLMNVKKTHAHSIYHGMVWPDTFMELVNEITLLLFNIAMA